MLSTNIDYNLMTTKREKFRVEIRKSHQVQEFETKRFQSLKKSTLENKENLLMNIFSNQEPLKPIEIFNYIEFHFQNNDYDQLLNGIVTLSRFVDHWDEAFQKEFFANQIPKKLIQILENKPNKKIIEEITSIFFQITGGSLEGNKSSLDGLIMIYDQLLENGSYDSTTLNNIIYGISNLCYDSGEFCNRVLDTVLLQKICKIYYKQENGEALKESMENLMTNILANIPNPINLKHSHVRELFNICRCLFHEFKLPTDDPKNEHLKNMAIRSAQGLILFTNRFNPFLVYEIMEEEFQFFIDLLNIVEKTEKKQEKFLCLCLEFVADMVSTPYVDNSVFKGGLFETVSFLLEKDNLDLVRKKALEILTSIPYKSTTNNENEIFGLFKDKFLDIMKGPISESKKELLKTLKNILKNCDPDDKDLLSFFNDKEIIHKIIECVEIDDISTKKNTLKLLENVLIVGMNEMARLNLTANPFAIYICQDNAFKSLEELQNCENQNIVDLAHKLFDNFLENV